MSVIKKLPSKKQTPPAQQLPTWAVFYFGFMTAIVFLLAVYVTLQAFQPRLFQAGPGHVPAIHLTPPPIQRVKFELPTAVPTSTPFYDSYAAQKTVAADDSIPTSEILAGAKGTVISFGDGTYQIWATTVLPSGEIAYPAELIPVTVSAEEDAMLKQHLIDSATEEAKK